MYNLNEVIYLLNIMAYSTSVNISIETQAENIIQEISYDGQEIYQP